MFRKAKTLLFVILFLTTTVCLAAKIPKQIDKWLVTVGPAGNAVYRPPKTIPEDTLKIHHRLKRFLEYPQYSFRI